MNVLITGGAGYLGSILTKELLDSGHSVTVLDSLKYNQLSLLGYISNPFFKFVYGDVRDERTLKPLCERADVIIPLAALVGFPICERYPQEATAVNYQQIVNIVKYGSKNVVIVYPNTNSGYGISEGERFCTEETPLNPISHYGVTKVDAEVYLREHTDAIILRLATVFGVSPRMRTDLLVNDFVYKAITDKYIVVFEKDFKRNFIHVNDVAQTFSFMINRFDQHKGEVFNVGLSNANLSKEELLEKIKQYVGDFAIVYDDYYKDPDKRDYIVSNEKIENIGWCPDWNLDHGIKQLIMGYQMIVPKMGAEFRNGFPLGYANIT